MYICRGSQVNAILALFMPTNAVRFNVYEFVIADVRSSVSVGPCVDAAIGRFQSSRQMLCWQWIVVGCHRTRTSYFYSWKMKLESKRLTCKQWQLSSWKIYISERKECWSHNKRSQINVYISRKKKPACLWYEILYKTFFDEPAKPSGINGDNQHKM